MFEASLMPVQYALKAHIIDRVPLILHILLLLNLTSKVEFSGFCFDGDSKTVVIIFTRPLSSKIDDNYYRTLLFTDLNT